MSFLRLIWCGRAARTLDSEEWAGKVGKPQSQLATPAEEDHYAKGEQSKKQALRQNLTATAGSNASADSSPAVNNASPAQPATPNKGHKDKSRRTATLQELSSKYQRGKFDPSNPAGRLKTKNGERISNSTPSPQTPEKQSRRSSIVRAETESNADSYESGEKDEINIFSTRSTLSNATSGRPQPVAELQSLLGVPELGANNSLSTEQSAHSVASCERISAGRASSAFGGEGSLPFAKTSPKIDKLFSKESLRSQEGSKSKDSKKNREKPKESSSLVPRKVSRTVRQSLRRQQSFGTPITIGRPTIEPYHRTMSSNAPGQLEGHPFYKVLGSLTGGTSGNVVVCLDQRTNEKVVVKMLARGVTNSKAAEREIANLRLCAMHPYIIHMREVFLTSSHLAIAMDYAEGGNLATYIEMYQSSKTGKGISEERARLIFQQIVIAVEFCHSMGFANRDIKLDNVLLVPNGDDKAAIPTVKLSDFGFSKDEYADSICKTACGTPECVAPEVLTGGLYDGKYSDIWSLGVLLYAMLTGNYPFSRPADKELEPNSAMRKLFTRIMNAKYAMPQHISREAQNLLEQMLKVNPAERIDVAEVLRHPFFTANAKKSKIMSVNRSLLQVPDSMLTGFFKQTDDQILQILKQASQSSNQRAGPFAATFTG